MPDALADANLIRVALMVLAVAVAVVTDLRHRRIPNVVTLPLALSGVVLGGLTGGWRGLALALAGCLAGLAIFLVPAFKLGWGKGDLKLVAALGAVGGPAFAVWLGLYALAAGGVLGLLWLKRQGAVSRVVGGMVSDVRGGTAPVARSGLAMPYALAIAAGLALALLVSPGLPR